jgi:hypothetical protein
LKRFQDEALLLLLLLGIKHNVVNTIGLLRQHKHIEACKEKTTPNKKPAQLSISIDYFFVVSLM